MNLVVIMRHKLDQYYTPENVAKELLLQAEFNNPRSCIDPTCGSGNLLLAANTLYENARLFGIDRDKFLIEKLKKERPKWYLSSADLNNLHRYSKTTIYSSFNEYDVLLLNPPFSQVKSKHVDTTYTGKTFRSSIGMSYLAKSLELFTPKQGALVIAPESMLHSELDEFARHLLEKNYEIKSICDLESTTFRGARVHSSVFKLIPRTTVKNYSPLIVDQTNKIKIKFVRGGLQVHLFNKEKKVDVSVPFIHTTALKCLKQNHIDSLVKTNINAHGRIIGAAVLLPRVGVPKKELIDINKFDTEVQLSDCLFAIQTDSIITLEIARDRILENWEEFVALYKGTGARYVTKSKLINWFATKRMEPVTDSV